MTTLVDTHAHLDGLEHGAAAAVEAALRRAAEAGVTRVVAVGGNPEGNRMAIEAARVYPGVRPAVGFDRYCASGIGLDFSELERQLSLPGVVAVGETGLDYHYDPQTAPAQEALFHRMLDLAASRVLPIIVHVREAEEAMAPMLRAHAANWTGEPDRIGVIHCFTGSPSFARLALDCGFFISFSGILTFPKADNVRIAAECVPESRLLVETDTPFLAPVPHRGMPNEPSRLPYVVEKLAQIKGVTSAHMAEVTTANARRLFSLD
jgi:TatD DNase family protein